MSGGEREIALLCELHDGLARLGPGSEQSTRRVLDLVPVLPAQPRIADLGCGTGASALVLAALIDSIVVAVDQHPPFVRALRERAVAGGLGARVHPVVADMAEPPFAPQSFDLLWCESAIYAVGRVRALSGWRRLLRTGGSLAFSELVWVTDERPVEAAAFWAENYPQMTDLAGVRADLAVSGYRLVAEFVAPQEDWRDGYYRPLAANFASFKRRHAADPLAMRTLSDQRQEMALVERHHGAFAYTFFVAVPA